MKKYYLGIFCKDWADEFDYSETFVYDENEKNYYEEMVEKYKDCEGSYYFGTNEGWEDVAVEEMDDSLSWKEISKSTYDELVKTLANWNIVLEFIEGLEDFEEEYWEED